MKTIEQICIDEINTQDNHPDVIQHYQNILNARQDKMYQGMKILIFQPVAAGDVISSSVSAELFQIKFPGCTVDYMTNLSQIKDLFSDNPFINQVRVEYDWNDYQHETTLEYGRIRKEYDLGYSLYWWSAVPSHAKSFLEDLDLPTDYTRSKIYLTEKDHEYGESFWTNSPKNRYRICLSTDMWAKWSTIPKWDVTKYPKLKELCKTYGDVVELGFEAGRSFRQDMSIASQADFYIGAHGGCDAGCSAINCQTIVTMTLFDPEAGSIASYQDKYKQPWKKTLTVKPENWCQNHWRCVSQNLKDFNYGPCKPIFPQNRFPPHMVKPCDFGYPVSCTFAMEPELFIDKLEEAIEIRRHYGDTR